MSDSTYTPPALRNIFLGILIFVLIMMGVGHLDAIVKWGGYLLLFLPNRLGLLQLVSPEQVTALDFSSSPHSISFPTSGSYALYTPDLDLLIITDQLMEEPHGQPWLKLSHQESGERVAVAFIRRGLMPYDTPFAKGRAIYHFEITWPGDYQLHNATRPGAVAYIVPDVITGNEARYGITMILEVILLAGLVVAILYPARSSKLRQERAKQIQNRRRAELLQQKNSKKSVR